jgi:hypothetical protein
VCIGREGDTYGREGMEEMKVSEYGGWTSYTYVKYNDEPSCFRCGRKGLRGSEGGGHLTNVQCKSIQNCHNESPSPTNLS